MENWERPPCICKRGLCGVARGRYGVGGGLYVGKLRLLKFPTGGSPRVYI